MRVGVEVGGTFTDLVAVDGDEVRIAKVPSVPARPDEGAFAAIEAAGLSPGRIDDLVHGSTVSTNAILERKGARIAFLVTSGFRDILLLQRQSRTSIYDLAYAKARPVVARRDSFEAEERVAVDGTVIVPLDRGAAAAQIEAWLGGGDYQAVAICLLNGYANPAHEEAFAGLIRARFPDLPVTCSSDVTREFREYERGLDDDPLGLCPAGTRRLSHAYRTSAPKRSSFTATSRSCSRTAGGCRRRACGATPSARCSRALPPA